MPVSCWIAAPWVIRRDGIIASVEADPDYTHRPEPEDTLKVLRALV